MKKNHRYDEIIKGMPLENGRCDLSPAIIAAAGINQAKPADKAGQPGYCFTSYLPQTVISLAVAVLILTGGLIYQSPEPTARELMGVNTVAIWGQVADSFKEVLGERIQDFGN